MDNMQSNTRNKVKVVIPLYQERLSDDEMRALKNNMAKLASHPVAFVVPESVDVSAITGLWPEAETIRVSDQWLGRANGIAGYNSMMLSADFYRLFTDCEYMLICHTDAWIFRDELDRWCDAGYDIVAAPWPQRARYERFPLKQLMAIRDKFSSKLHRSMIYNRVGNGGLSLRRVSSCIAACGKYRGKIDEFLSYRGHSLYNEDVFWALIPTEFRYPDSATALAFGFDYRPQLCYKLSGGKMPMGCHGFTKRRHRKFWKNTEIYKDIKYGSQNNTK